MEERVVLYPAPGIGHLVPLVELGKRLINHRPSLKITLLITNLPMDYNTAATSAYIATVSATCPSITFHSFPTLSLPHDPSTYHNPEDIVFDLLRLNSPNVRQFLHSLSLSAVISAFIIDFFCTPALEIGKSLNIPTYYFFVSGASALVLFLNFPVIDRKTSGSFRDSTVSFEFEGLPLIPAKALLEPMLDRGKTFEEFVNVGAQIARSDGVIVNSFEKFESRAIRALNEGVCVPKGYRIPPVYCIGPLISTADSGESGGGKRHECLSWLDLQPRRTVVFLCFGSLGLFQKDQLREIAVGLERSGQRFLWVVRDPPPLEDISKRFTKPPDPDLDEILPAGFLDRTKERGLVIKTWAPQKAIISHPSVGAFVNHCGWNSALEAVSVGLPLIAWPLFAEQRFNRITLVEETGVALPMDEVEGVKFVTSAEVERRVREIMESKEGEMVRKRILDLKVEAEIAFHENGSSTLALANLVKSWYQGSGY